jgi:hypothetical protein
MFIFRNAGKLDLFVVPTIGKARDSGGVTLHATATTRLLLWHLQHKCWTSAEFSISGVVLLSKISLRL